MPIKDKVAKAIYDRERYKLNRNTVIMRVSEYQQRNSALVKQRKAEWYNLHKSNLSKRSAEHYQTNTDRIKHYQAKTLFALKLAAIEAYGGQICQLCSENRLGALHIDHVDGNGSEHRKTIKNRNIYRWLRDNNYPNNFRVLCSNCNHEQHLARRILLNTKSASACRRSNAKLKLVVMQHFGSQCKTCGKTSIDILTIHHIKNNGAVHRREVSNGYASTPFYRWLIRTNDFTDLECRCFSCNDNEAFLQYKSTGE